MADQNGDVIVLDPRRNQSMERKKLFEEMLLKEMPGTSRTNEPMHAVLEDELGESEMTEGSEIRNVRNRALLHYLASLANSNSTKDTFDFNFVESLFKNGADVNSTDKTGQTVFHEVARSWNNDVASFLIKHGANVNQQDLYGRSPLHVAAAVDYAEMVEFLLQNGADIDIKTSGEGQTAMHFAAKNDAINSLQMLLGYEADIDARDSKNRTPLQVAAEMNRSKAAKLLISEGAPAGVYDNLGNSALSLLIEKIPEVALDAMDQFQSTDIINRKEFYFLNYLEGTKLNEENTHARTPLEITVQNERFDIIMHPVMQRLIGAKWQCYGKWGAVQDLALNLIYTILWTLLAVTLPKYGRDLYIPIGPNSWRLVIGIFLILLTIVEIRKQILNTIKTRQEHNAFKEWRASELERDIEYCHPRWPQEAQYVNAEIKAVRNISLMSGSDYWIYFDWVALLFIFATIVSHVIFFYYSTNLSKDVHHYITMPLLLILWLRIFKYARPFESAGPFIVIFSSVLGDIAKWAFLNLVIVIPFTCAFWMTFGAVSITPVEGYDHVGPLLYNIFSMMVVNNHGFENIEKANPFMARLLCGSFIAVAAIVTINLLIALVTNTFERLYENAIANAVMQRAQTILLLQKSLRRKQISKYYSYIKEKGSPEVISRNLGRVMTMDSDEATIERVRDDVKAIMKILGEQFGKKFRKGKNSDMDFVRMDISKLRQMQEEMVVHVRNMKLSFEEVQVKLTQLSSTSKTIMNIPTIMNTTDFENRNEQNSNQNESTNSEESNSDESNSPSDEDNDNGNANKNIDANVAKEENNKNNKYGNKSDKRKIDKEKTKSKNLGENSKHASGGKLDLKSRKQSHMGSGQKKLRKRVKSLKETGNFDTDSDSPSEEQDNEEMKSGDKKAIKFRNKSDKKTSRKKLMKGLKNSQNDLSNLGERRPETASQNDDGATRRRLENPPGNANTPLYDVRDVPLKTLTYPPGHVPSYEVPNNDQNMAYQRLLYPPAGQPQTFFPGLWKHQDIPYNPPSQTSFSSTHEQNQLMLDYRKKQESSPSVLMQHDLYPQQLHYVYGNPYVISGWNDPSDGMVLQHRSGYVPGKKIGKDEMKESTRPGKQATSHIIQNQNQPQVFSNAAQPTIAQHSQEPKTYASQNYGFERDGGLVKPNPHDRYPPGDQISTRFGIKQSTQVPQEYRQKEYDKDQTLSPSSSYNQIWSSPIRMPSLIPSTKSSFSAFPTSRSGSSFCDDQNSAHVAVQNRERERSFSLQPARSELEIISKRRQSENVNVKRPSFQIIQKEFHEPLQSLRQTVKQDAFSQASLPPGTEANLEGERTQEFENEERFMSNTTPEPQDYNGVHKSQT